MPEEKEFQSLKTEVAVLSSRVKDWMDTTVEYRTTLCVKLDKISENIKLSSDKIIGLPCKEEIAKSEEKFKNIDKWLGLNWTATIMLISAIVYEWVKGKK